MKKYYNMTLIGFAGLSFYLFIKKYPKQAYSGIGAARQLIKTLPIDPSASYLFDPILNSNFDLNFNNFKKSNSTFDNSLYNYNENKPINSLVNNLNGNNNNNNNYNNNNNTKTTKRVVSETKKKYVASQQEWKCGDCKTQLNAWFEVDHIHSLEKGGSNHVSNLIALCRECHGKKTAMERMGML